MLAGEPVTIFGDGEQTRDYIEISDVIRSMTTAMQKLENNDVSLGVYNICTGTPTTINQLAAKLLKLTGSKSSIVYSQQRSDDIRFSQGDSTLARAELGFATEVVLGDGLINMLKYK
jgi:UDP-glucose 4-epimerase